METENGHLVFIMQMLPSQVWWCMPVVEAAQEAEAGGLLELKSLRHNKAHIKIIIRIIIMVN